MDPVDPQAEVENANNNNSGLIVSGDADVGSWSNNENKIINEPKFDIRIETSKSDLAVQQQLSEIARLRTKLEGRKNALVNFEDRVECIKREKREYEYRVEKLKMDISLLESRLSDEICRRGEYEAEGQKRCKELEAKVDRKRVALDKQKENVQKLEKEISVLESKLSEERAGKIRTEEDAQRQREKLEAEIKNKRRALQKRNNEVNRLGNEVSTLDSKLSEEMNRREKLEAETQRERQELEASIKQKHLEFLDMRDLHEKTISAQKKEISSLGCTLSDEIRNMTAYKEKVELEKQELKAAVEKECCAYLDMQKEKESLIIKHKVEISRFSTMLSEERSQRTSSEAEALRVRQELEATVEKERNAFFDLQEQKMICEKQDAEISKLESKLSEETHLRAEVEVEAQRERQEFESALNKERRSLLDMETLIGKKKEEISLLGARLSEESRRRVESEEEVQRRCQELDAMMEKERLVSFDLKKEKEKVSTLNSKLSAEIRRRKDIEMGTQQEHQALIDEKRRELVRTQEHRENAVSVVKEVTSTEGPEEVPTDFEIALDSFLSASEAEVRPDLDVIATGVEESLEVIRSWSRAQSKDPVVLVFIDGIQKQSGPYVTAIDQSIKTAEQGSAFSADVIGFCDILLDPDTKPEDIAGYASEMRQTTSKAVHAATEVFNLFRNIRKASYQIAADMNKVAAVPKSRSSFFKRPERSILRKSIDLEKAVEGLQKFSLNVKRFTNWWMNMETTLKVIKGIAESGAGRLRIEHLKERWEEVDKECKTYANKMDRVRDRI